VDRETELCQLLVGLVVGHVVESSGTMGLGGISDEENLFVAKQIVDDFVEKCSEPSESLQSDR